MENLTPQTEGSASEQLTAAAEAPKEISINPDKLTLYMEKLRLEQNLPYAFMVGLGAAVIGALLWAAITVVTNYQIGYMAIGLGIAVGFAIRYAGNGMDLIFGIVGAALAFIGCVAGNFLSMIGFFANEEGLGYFETFALIDFALIPEIMISAIHPMDFLFYGLALYFGYKFSFRNITEQEIIDNAAE